MTSTRQRKSGGFRIDRVDRRGRLVSGAILIGIALLLLRLATAHPSVWIPTCPTNQYLGFLCPGCGSMRATHHLLNLRLGEAFDHNPLLVVLGVPLAVVYIIEQFMSACLARRPVLIPRSATLAWAALAILLLFAIARNLPGPLHDALAPPEHQPEAHSRSISTPPGIALRNDLP